MFEIALPPPQPRSGLHLPAAYGPCRGYVEADASHLPLSKRQRLIRLAKVKAHFEHKLRKEAKWK